MCVCVYVCVIVVTTGAEQMSACGSLGSCVLPSENFFTYINHVCALKLDAVTGNLAVNSVVITSDQ